MTGAPLRPVSFAWLTPRGIGAIAVARVWGAGAIRLVARLLDAPPPVAPRVARRWLQWAGERIDEVVVRPVSGATPDEEWCELATHGGIGISRAVGRALVAAGAVETPFVPALARARAEAELALARASTELALDAALYQCGGALDHALARIANHACAAPEAQALAREIADAADLGEALFSPRRVAIVGPTGVGKSRLVNALLGEERSLRGHGVPVTRDWLAAPLCVRGVPFELVDTPADPDIARRAVVGAQVLVRLHRVDTPPWPPEAWAPCARLLDRTGEVDAAELAAELVRPYAAQLARGVNRPIPVHPAQWELARALVAATPAEQISRVRAYLGGSAIPWPDEEAP